MKPQVISFHCILKSYTGRLISSAYYQEVMTDEAGRSGVLAALIQGLQNLKKGEKRKITISANQAYGFYEPGLVIRIPRKKLPISQAIDVGREVITQDNGGSYRAFRVVSILDKSVVLDGNHPLAGQDLVFEIEATATRFATPREMAASQFRAAPTPKDSLH